MLEDLRGRGRNSIQVAPKYMKANLVGDAVAA